MQLYQQRRERERERVTKYQQSVNIQLLYAEKLILRNLANYNYTCIIIRYEKQLEQIKLLLTIKIKF